MGSFVPATDSGVGMGIVADAGHHARSPTTAPRPSAPTARPSTWRSTTPQRVRATSAPSTRRRWPRSRASLLLDPSYRPGQPDARLRGRRRQRHPDGRPRRGRLLRRPGAGVSGNNYRGYLLHFDGTLATEKLPSAFGWDDTPSIVPASAVPSYLGQLVVPAADQVQQLCRRPGATGNNKLAVVDPNGHPWPTRVNGARPSR